MLYTSRVALNVHMHDSDCQPALPPSPWLQLASDPVVTLCGHLYCWPCLFRWMHVQSHARTCPVCKASLDLTRVVPIYGHGEHQPRSVMEVAHKQAEGAVVAPSRPLGQRETPGARDGRGARDGEGSRSGATAPLSALPSFFNLSGGGGGGGFVEPLSSEQQHQAFLSRLLLMLGSFVIMCLLLF